MYSLAVRRDFVAQHYLIGGDWGAENSLHSHHYVVELQLEGSNLDRHGYLVDITAVEASLDRFVEQFKDRTLNDLPEFKDLNPSIEHFARIAALRLAREMDAPDLQAVTVRIWENDIAWTAFRVGLPVVPS